MLNFLLYLSLYSIQDVYLFISCSAILTNIRILFPAGGLLMFGKSRSYRYFVMPMILVVSLFMMLSPISFTASHARNISLVGPKKYYLALGDSLAFGFQPDFDFGHGYVDYFFSNLKRHGVKDLVNLGCFAETSNTFINVSCPQWFLRKYLYLGSQLPMSSLPLAVQAHQTRTSVTIPGCVVSFMKFTLPTKATALWPPLL